MSDNVGSKISFFLVGLGIGAAVGVLFAPRSGDETRDLIAKRASDGKEFLSSKADDGREFASRKARELRERADELIERGKDVAARKKESISAAVDAGREAYLREASARPERG
jgi:gas vesicle protein